MSLDLGTLVAYVEADDTKYSATLDKAEGRMSRFAGALGRGLALAGGAFVSVAGAAGAIGLRTAASNEQAQISFNTMLGSAKQAQKFLADLGTFAAKTPFEFPELQTAAQSLISVGVRADKVIPIMTSLGNATSGMGTGSEGVKRATVALQQMNAAGRISMEDLNQLRDAGIPVYDLLAAATGKSVKQVAELAGKGKLGRTELEQLMKALESGKGLERFTGMMEKQSVSLTGLWSTLQDTFTMGMARAIEPLLPLIKDGLGKAIEFVSANIPKLRSGLVTVVTAAQGLYSLIVGGDFTGKLSEAFGWSDDEQIVATILQIRDSVISLFSSFDTSGASSTIGSLFDTVSGGASNLMSSLPALEPTLQLIGDGLGWVADNADTVGKYLPAVIAGFAALKAAQAANSVIGRDSAIGLGLELAGKISLTASNYALAASNRALTTSEQATAAAANASLGARLRGAAASTAAAARSAASWVASNATTAATSVASAAATAAAWVAASARTVGGLVAQGAAFVATRVAMLAGAAATGIVTAAQWLLNAALNANPIGLVVLALAALVAGLVYAWNHSETFRNIVLGAWSAIKTAVLAVVDWLKTAVPAVFAWIKNAFLTYTPLGLVISHWGQIMGAVRAVVAWFQTAIPAVLGWIKNAFLNYTPLGIVISHWGQIQGFISGAVAKVRGIIGWFAGLPAMMREWFGRAKDGAVSMLGNLLSWVTGLPGRVVSALGDLGSTLLDKGADLVRGMIEGIGSMAGRLAAYIRQFVKDHIPGPIAEALGIKSPSTVARDLLRWVPLGGIEGLKQTGPQLRRYAERVFDLGDISATFGVSPAMAGAPALAVAAQGGSVAGRSAAAAAFPESLTLLDADGSILARARVIADDTYRTNSARAARAVMSRRGGR